MTGRGAADRHRQRLGLYVHWPGDLAEEDRLVDALADAAARQLARGERSLRPVSVLIGGAAPPPSANATSDLLRGLATVMPADAEVSLEVDPGALRADALAGYRGSGVSRLVIRAGALDAVTPMLVAAARATFERVALDLTFGRATQTARRFRAELDRAVALGVGHLSLAEASPDDPELGAELYLLAWQRLSALGLPPYDVAHFARPGEESCHHLHVATGGAYLGIGPGAIGRLQGGGRWWASRQTGSGQAWLAAIDAGGEGLDERRPLAPAERARELLTSGLRLRAGIARRWFEPLAGSRLEEVLPASTVGDLVQDGFVELDDDGLRLTDRGWPLCDAVLRRLLP